jgi:NADH-quinone oxidoreductase subunit L
LDQKSYILFSVGVFVAALTTFYMFRLFFVAFVGKARTEKSHHAHEAPVVMYGPLVVLAVFALVGGVIGVVNIYNSQFNPSAENLSFLAQLTEPFHAVLGMVCGLGAVVVGLLLAWSLYGKAETDPLPAKLGWIATAMKNRFYFDELYEATFIRLHDTLAAIAGVIDRIFLEGMVIGTIRGGTDIAGRALRLVQNGNLQAYAFLFVAGVAVLLYFVLGK